MKKLSIAVLVVVLMITIIVTPFARPVVQCPSCSGEYYSSTPAGDWQVSSIGTCTPHWEKDHWDGHYTEQRKIVVSCSNGSHTYMETRQRTKCDVNLSLWGWSAILH